MVRRSIRLIIRREGEYPCPHTRPHGARKEKSWPRGKCGRSRSLRSSAAQTCFFSFLPRHSLLCSVILRFATSVSCVNTRPLRRSSYARNDKSSNSCHELSRQRHGRERESKRIVRNIMPHLGHAVAETSVVGDKRIKINILRKRAGSTKSFAQARLTNRPDKSEPRTDTHFSRPLQRREQGSP